MSELQASLEFSVELCKFYNIDLFQRGFYRIRTELRTSQKLSVKIETNIRKSERKETILPACVEDGCGISRTFRILYRNEEITLGDTIVFRVHILVDSHKIEETLDQANFSLIIELWFTDQTIAIGRQLTITCVSSRTLQLNFSCSKGLHYNLPVVFDYFHLSAITVTIHGMLIALHQPYIKKGLLQYMQSCTSRSGKPWLGGNSQKFNLWLPQSAIETVFPTQLHNSSTKCVSSNGMQLSHIQHTHREVCALLLSSYESLRKTVLQYINLLPPWQRQKMKTTDCIQEILSTSDVEKANENEEEIIARANSDIAQLCTENMLLWQQFLDTFCRKEAIHQYLGKRHHQLRVRRFAEAFFVVDNPRQSAAGCYDQNYQNYIAVSEMVRRSRYWASLPSLPVHCVELDGDLNTLPIIFEDQYQDIAEFARRRSAANGRKSGSDSFINSYGISEVRMNDVKLQDTTIVGTQEDCSCGIAEILESRSSHNKKIDSSTNGQDVKFYYTTDVEDYKMSCNKENCGDASSLNPSRHSKSLEHLLKTAQPATSPLSFPFQFSYQLSKCCHSPTGNLSSSSLTNAVKTLDRVDSSTLPTRRGKQQLSYNYRDDDSCVSTLPLPVSSRKSKKTELKNGCVIDRSCRERRLLENSSEDAEKKKLSKQQRQEYATTAISRNPRSIILIKDGGLKFETRDRYIRDVLNKSATTAASGNSRQRTTANDPIATATRTMKIDNAIDRTVINGKRLRNETSSSDSCGSGFIAPVSRKLKEATTSRSMPFISSSSSVIEVVVDDDRKRADDHSKIRPCSSSSSMPEFKTRTNLTSADNRPFDDRATTSVSPTTVNVLKPPSFEPRTSSSLSDSDITSEQSGWVSSRYSSSSASSNDQITPTGNELNSQDTHTVINGDVLRAKLEKLIQKQNRVKRNKIGSHISTESCFERRHTEPKVTSSSPSGKYRPKHHPVSAIDISSPSPSPLLNDRSSSISATSSSSSRRKIRSISPYDKMDLPPPRQFQDVPPPPEPFRDPPESIDNILYYMYEAVLNNEQSKSSYDNKSELSKNNTLSCGRSDDLIAENVMNETECQYCTDENIFTGKTMLIENDEIDSNFKKYKQEFKEQINFTGLLYSDFPTLASTLPYFHISDEYRMFSPEGLHLVVCVHGLDGNSADLRLVKTYIELGLPGANLEFLMSERNQGDTFSDFDTMTDRLVSEILYHIESFGLNPAKVSFVGHSLGNIIIRAAIARPQLKHLLPRLHTFLSLSGPHLGTLYNSSGLVNMGLWFMQKLKKSGTLLQLSLRDAADIRKTFLYRLSQHCHLNNFQNILLFGSSQDRYVPLHSARIELCKAAIKDNSITGAAYREMVHNIIYPIINKPNVTFVRYDVHHVLPNTANSLIGRAAHIALLDSDLFIEKFMVVTGLKYFR